MSNSISATEDCVDCGCTVEAENPDLQDAEIETEYGVEIWWKGDFIGYQCIDCTCPTIDWSAEDELWEIVMGPWDAGHICPSCFMMRADRMDIHTTISQWFCDECEDENA